jgi:hypothetical protein
MSIGEHWTRNVVGATADSGVEAAIARVLDAECAARAAVVDAGRRAATIHEAARAAAQTLGARTESRIRAVRAAFGRCADAQVAALAAQAGAADIEHEPTPDELARIDLAVAKLAARLCQ